jgi:hypothetical protein
MLAKLWHQKINCSMKKFFLVSFSALALIACKKEEKTDTNSNKGQSVWVDNDITKHSKRITYINEPLDLSGNMSGKRSSYGTESNIASTPPTNCTSGCTDVISTAVSNHMNISSNQHVCITSTGSFSGGINMNGGTLSICGNVQLTYLNLSNATVIVNDGATFSLSSPLNINNGSKFVNYSTSNVFISGGFNNNSNAENYGTIDVTGHFNNNSQATFKNNCRVNISGNFNQNGTLHHFGFLNITGTATFNATQGSNNLNSGSLISCSNLMQNATINGLGNNYSRIDVSNKTTINSSGTINGLVDLCDANGIETNNGTLGNNVTLCQNGVAANGTCNTGSGPVNVDFTLVANVDAPTVPGSGNHKLSATCIQIIGNYAYVSWHWNRNPDDYAGLLEVYNISNPTAPLIVSTLWSTDIDFNHVFVDDIESVGQRKMWAVGSRNVQTSGLNSPAWLGQFTLTNNIFTMNTFTETDLPSFSGNSVIKKNDALYLTSGKTGGALTSFDLNNNILNVESNDERLKYLDFDGNYMIALQQQANNSMLHRYSLPNPDFANPVSLTVGSINPDDGKSVAHIDGNRVYVCTGVHGLKVYDVGTMSSTPLHHFAPGVGGTNGTSTDNDYIYVANGAGGLYIINKSDYSVLGNYKFQGSANFVASKSNFIFVANGTGGLKIIRRN